MCMKAYFKRKRSLELNERNESTNTLDGKSIYTGLTPKNIKEGFSTKRASDLKKKLFMKTLM